MSTPIGNLKDISLRAIEVLGQVDVILCEDTRKTGQMLKSLSENGTIVSNSDRFNLVSFYEQNEEARIPQVIGWLKEGKDVALVSSAGTPLISDPGFKLVRQCVREGIPVSPIPGASATLAALVVSGLPTDKFMFLGFLPKKSGKRNKLLESALKAVELVPQTVIFYESPFRLNKSLAVLAELAPEAKVVIARELTKKFEEVIRGSAKKLAEEFAGKKVKGEVSVLFQR